MRALHYLSSGCIYFSFPESVSELWRLFVGAHLPEAGHGPPYDRSRPSRAGGQLEHSVHATMTDSTVGRRRRAVTHM